MHVSRRGADKEQFEKGERVHFKVQGPVLPPGAALSAAEGLCPLRVENVEPSGRRLATAAAKGCGWVVAGFP